METWGKRKKKVEWEWEWKWKWKWITSIDSSDPSNGKTLLIYAASFKQNEMLKMLLNFGADVDKKDHLGKKALDNNNINIYIFMVLKNHQNKN